MKALRYFGPRDVRYESMDDPVLHDDRDVLVRVTGCSICGRWPAAGMVATRASGSTLA